MRFLPPQDKAAPSSGKPTAKHMIISLAYVAVNGTLGVPLIFYIRDSVMLIAEMMGITFWSWNFIETATVIILVILWLVMVYVGQHFYEKEVTVRWVPKLFIVITAVQLVLYGGLRLFLGL